MSESAWWTPLAGKTAAIVIQEAARRTGFDKAVDRTVREAAERSGFNDAVSRLGNAVWDYATSSSPAVFSPVQRAVVGKASTHRVYRTSDETKEQERKRQRQEREEKQRRWAEEFRRQELLRTIQSDRTHAKVWRLKREQSLLRQRQLVLQHVQRKLKSKRRFFLRKDVKEFGAKLTLRCLRSLATHSFLTVCTKGLGTKLAIFVDKDNCVHIGKLTVDLQNMYNDWKALENAIDGLLGLDFLLEAWTQMTDLDPGNPDLSSADLDQMEANADRYYEALRAQNQQILDQIQNHPAMLKDVPGAKVMEPQFGSWGPARFDSDLIGPDGERTTCTDHGTYLDYNNHDKVIDPLSCTKQNPAPIPPPPPDPPTISSTSAASS